MAKFLNILYKIAGIIIAIVAILELVNGLSSPGDIYENTSGTIIKDNDGNVNVARDVYDNSENYIYVEVKNKISNIIYNVIDKPKISDAAKIIEDVQQKSNEEFHKNSIDMEFVKIPAGEFMMGSPPNEKYRENDEGPVHKVTIEKPFYLGKFEITQGQWQKVMGYNPSTFKGEDLPVEGVSWNDAQEFVDKLNEMEKTDKYRLPSEAEWEYACRAGTNTKYFFGDDESKLGDYAWYLSNSNNETHPVGQKKSNPWELYDMYGNVWEWVQDKWHEDYSSAPSDGSAWEGGVYSYVARGSSFRRTSSKEDPDFAGCRSANRGGNRDLITHDKGFRLLREL